MPKNKSRSGSFRPKSPQLHSAKIAEKLAAEKAIAIKLVNLFQKMNLVALVFSVVVLVKLTATKPPHSWWIYASLGTLVVLTFIGRRLQKRAAPGSDVMTQVLKDPTEFRRKATTFLALLILQNIVAAFPLLYWYGFFTWAANWVQSFLPRSLAISENIYIGASFVIAAVVSGILGNFAYDILKHFIMKTLQRRR